VIPDINGLVINYTLSEGESSEMSLAGSQFPSLKNSHHSCLERGELLCSIHDENRFSSIRCGIHENSGVPFATFKILN